VLLVTVSFEEVDNGLTCVIFHLPKFKSLQEIVKEEEIVVVDAHGNQFISLEVLLGSLLNEHIMPIGA
jgi:hypothetical protein